MHAIVHAADIQDRDGGVLLMATLFGLYPFLLMVMLPPDLRRLGSSGVATTLFISNFYFWAQGQNYLRDLPDFEPLLHR